MAVQIKSHTNLISIFILNTTITIFVPIFSIEEDTAVLSTLQPSMNIDLILNM